MTTNGLHFESSEFDTTLTDLTVKDGMTVEFADLHFSSAAQQKKFGGAWKVTGIKASRRAGGRLDITLVNPIGTQARATADQLKASKLTFVKVDAAEVHTGDLVRFKAEAVRRYRGVQPASVYVVTGTKGDAVGLVILGGDKGRHWATVPRTALVAVKGETVTVTV